MSLSLHGWPLLGAGVIAITIVGGDCCIVNAGGGGSCHCHCCSWWDGDCVVNAGGGVVVVVGSQ